jgi:hypothetical protein
VSPQPHGPVGAEVVSVALEVPVSAGASVVVSAALVLSSLVVADVLGLVVAEVEGFVVVGFDEALVESPPSSSSSSEVLMTHATDNSDANMARDKDFDMGRFS